MIKDYFLGFLLLPWIWIWGFQILLSTGIWYYEFNKDDSFIFELSKVFSDNIPLIEIWTVTSTFVFCNYTFAFLLKKRYPKLQYFFVSSSFLILIYLALITWPHFTLVLSTD